MRSVRQDCCVAGYAKTYQLDPEVILVNCCLLVLPLVPGCQSAGMEVLPAAGWMLPMAASVKSTS